MATASDRALKAQVRIHTIQAGRSSFQKKPLFFFHGDRSDSPPFYCYTLSRTLGSHQPFYLVDAYDYAGEVKPLTLEELAAIYIQAIRAIQPEGPYQLAGFCGGSYIVYEMARQLQVQGEQIASLIMIAPSEINRKQLFVRKSIQVLGNLFRIQQQRQQLLFLQLRQIIAYMNRRLYPADHRHNKYYPILFARDEKIRLLFPPAQTLYHDYSGVFISLATLYRPLFQPAHCAFIWTDQGTKYRYRWKQSEDRERSTILPGYYMDLLEENIQLLAKTIKFYTELLPNIHESSDQTLSGSPYHSTLYPHSSIAPT
ncbi:thioesterase domain-containing protein [Tengunoibacter tsumagoiensis]|uniref:Thioesterase domain-containing protein n=1 Tax=Tengunoibacter tsumagoiensis TaxID=2014871 RepID=A0A401ZY03_9CHLR|nr:thioesterase domain-containing protein [Tengunoibacter tsumagoiensis]GCE11734.1 hypothetical protein KTT_15930 [Tengunoibacter tsumagoiensis]